ncbi:SOS response-associated peptidase [Companilactobacillus nodensis]|uniref:SOS response-associated peptidase n=1 Tax=Companilactobacillus nodensis TaxID=460870 RepID=UPI000468FD65|nr:SOS response-associated peptidase family protein [Companilactobacillus nodensis]
MCGRFTFQPNDNAEIKRIYQLAVDNGYEPKTGEVFPTDQTAIVKSGDNQVQVVTMKWGFPGFKQDQNIINARSETIMQKPMFAESFRNRRCVYPTTGFFEWSEDKVRHRFNYGTDPETLYIAGCYKVFDGEPHSVLLTTAPNDSMIQIHDRMPLILQKKQIKSWIYDQKFAIDFLDSPMPMLENVPLNN